MIHLVTGGSGSGKSAYAEKLVTAQYKGDSKYYIATMQVYDEEGKARIERHRQMRSGKGFTTIEQPACIEEALTKIDKWEEKQCVAVQEEKEGKQHIAVQEEKEGKQHIAVQKEKEGKQCVAEQKEKQCVALVECMSNLAANEIFQEEEIRPYAAVERILKGIKTLSKHLHGLVIVTNNVFEDGIEYDAGTQEYLKALGQINEGLASMADTVTEVVVGIPVPLKGCPAKKDDGEEKAR